MQSKPQSIEQPLGRVFTLLGRDFLALLNHRLKHLELERHYYAMVLIDAADGEITQQELAKQLDIDKVLIVRIINHLSDMGYVQRVRHAVDKRKFCLQLTTKAKSEIINITAAMVEVNNIAFRGLSAEQIASFQQVLRIIKSNLKSEQSQ